MTRWGIGGCALAALAVVVGSGVLTSPGLSDTWPTGLPDVTGWETVSGSAEFDDPHRTLEYEFYVSPARGGVYSLTRYRITIEDPKARAAARIDPTEKLQWDRDGRDVRRFECVGASRAADACEWREMPKGSEAYVREMGSLLWIYALHRRLLEEQETASAP